MGKPINTKCLECSKLNLRKGNGKILSTKPKCYVDNVCSKKRCYYRKIEYYRSKLRSYHRYIKFMDNKCLVCGSTAALQGHHVQSQASGGLDTERNIVTLCTACHKVITIYNRRLGFERELL
jgi:5-methylcytosine-specific restriction endonuclease McrA